MQDLFLRRCFRERSRPFWTKALVVEMISALLDPLNSGERLSSYIDLPKRLGCPAPDPDRLHCLQATSRLPGGAWRSLGEPISAYSGGDEWRDLKREFLTGLALFAGGHLTDLQ